MINIEQISIENTLVTSVAKDQRLPIKIGGVLKDCNKRFIKKQLTHDTKCL